MNKCMWFIYKNKQKSVCEYTKALNGFYSLCNCDGVLRNCIYYKRQIIEQESEE